MKMERAWTSIAGKRRGQGSEAEYVRKHRTVRDLRLYLTDKKLGKHSDGKTSHAPGMGTGDRECGTGGAEAQAPNMTRGEYSEGGGWRWWSLKKHGKTGGRKTADRDGWGKAEMERREHGTLRNKLSEQEATASSEGTEGDGEGNGGRKARRTCWKREKCYWTPWRISAAEYSRCQIVPNPPGVINKGEHLEDHNAEQKNTVQNNNQMGRFFS